MIATASSIRQRSGAIDGTSSSVLDCIGRTPVVQLSRYLDQSGVDLYAKLESHNPGGSAKDRPAKQMIEAAVHRGEIGPGSTIVESSSGNMGIGLAQVCRFHQMQFICVVDPNAQSQNLQIMRAMGAKIELVDRKVDGSYLAARIKRVNELIQQHPDSYWPNQYANPANPQSHFEGTIAEIDNLFGDDLDYLFVATSSTGTAQGCRQGLRRRNRHCKVVAVDACGSVLFGGQAAPRHIPGLGAGQMPPLALGQTFDGLERVDDLDCVVGCRRGAKREAMLVGGSAGGVLEAVRRRQDKLVGKRVVAILHDSGTRYLDTVFCDHWVSETLSIDRQQLDRLIDPQPFPDDLEKAGEHVAA